MRCHRLVRDVVLVDPPSRLCHGEGVEGLAGREPLQPRNTDLDHETAAGLEVRRRVAEARDLRRLRGQVHDRVEHQVGEGERPVHRGRGEVADRHADSVRAGLRPQPRDHRLRHVDAVHRHAALRQRERDPARPDPELERASTFGELGEEVDRRVDGLRIEHARSGHVVPGGDAFVEVAVVVHGPNLLLARPTGGGYGRCPTCRRSALT